MFTSIYKHLINPLTEKQELQIFFCYFLNYINNFNDWSTNRFSTNALSVIYFSNDRGEGEQTLRTLMPAILSPWACLLRSSVTVEIGFRPAFSASVEGITSRESLYARTQYASMPPRVREYSARRTASSISGAPPPAIRALRGGGGGGGGRDEERSIQCVTVYSKGKSANC